MTVSFREISLSDDRSEPLLQSEQCQQLISIYEEFYSKIGYNPPWIGYYIFADNQIAGTCGFAGKPVHNQAEIAYWTFAGFEGQGIATEACKHLIALARKAEPGITITAKTEPGNNASGSILKKLGFIYKGVVQDHEIGDAWQWELHA